MPAPAGFSRKSKSTAVPGTAPQATFSGNSSLLYVPSRTPSLAAADVPSAQPAAGTSRAYFSSSRLTPLEADLSYPYSAVGKLFFTVLGSTGATPGDFVCSASVIRNRVVLTAGHCVHSGFNSLAGFFTNFLFVPAFRDGKAPYGSWRAQQVLTTQAWSIGSGTIPNVADYALLVMSDLNSQSLGAVVGQLGYATKSLAPNHVTFLGYPCNIDSCQKMHQVSSGAYFTLDEAPNCFLYGSDMGPGSSGGPLVQNLGTAGDGQPTNTANPGRNVVVGVVSFGYTQPEPLAQGASIFDLPLTDMVAGACALATGNC